MPGHDKQSYVRAALEELAREQAAIRTRGDAEQFRSRFEATVVFAERMIGGMVVEPAAWQELLPTLDGPLRDAEFARDPDRA